MSSLYLRCACGARFDYEWGNGTLDIGYNDNLRREWADEHRGHGFDAEIARQIREVKAQIEVLSAEAGVEFKEPEK